MKNMLAINEHEIISAICIIAAVPVLFFLTRLIHSWLMKKEMKQFPDKKVSALNLIKRILDVLWIVLGISGLAIVFMPGNRHSALLSNFQLVIYLAMISVITIVSATTINLWFKKIIQQRIENQYDPTSYKFLRYVIVVLIYFTGIICIFLAFPAFRGMAQTALGGAGILALILGIASQEAFANVIGGIFIVSFKPFKVGDLVKISDTMVGTVTDVTLRHTVIRNFENKMIVIPNSIINKEKIINFDLGELKCCERIEIGISYDSDIDLAKKIMQEECENHPLIFDNRSDEDKANNQPVVRTAVMSLNEYSVTVRAWAWGANFSDCFKMRIDNLESIKKRFTKEGIEIPYPYRNIVVKNGSVKEEISKNL